MSLTYFAVTGLGAFIGACLRLLFGVLLNPVYPLLPLGTLAANLCGGLLMGLCLELLGPTTGVSQELRLFLTTGFLGGLTTFSAFSGETVSLLLRHEYPAAGGIIAAHLIGSLAMTFLGVMLVRWCLRP